MGVSILVVFLKGVAGMRIGRQGGFLVILEHQLQDKVVHLELADVVCVSFVDLGVVDHGNVANIFAQDFNIALAIETVVVFQALSV